MLNKCTRRRLGCAALPALLTGYLFSTAVRAQQPAPPATALRLAPHGVPRAECFPVERLSAPDRIQAEALLLKMLDTEALYTVVGGIKPMSSGYTSLYVDTKNPAKTAPQLDNTRRALSALTCGDAFLCEMVPFRAVGKDNRRYVEGVVFYRTAFRAAVARRADFWGPFGVTGETNPLVALTLIENDPSTARNRGLGFLFGYPDYAVNFFVQSADEEARTKKFVARDFINIPTWERPANQFVYAVPKGHSETGEDKALREKASLILAEYRRRRPRYIGPSKAGAAALLRDWFDDGTGVCAPGNARFGDENLK